MVAKAVASQAGFHFINVDCSSIASKYKGESENLVSTLFAVARAAKPGAILFLDECDSLLRKPGGGDDAAMDAKIVNQFKASWDGVESAATGSSPIFVIGATNNPWDLDEAITRPGRMDFGVLISLPLRDARKAMLEGWLRKDERTYDAEAIEAVLNATEGYSGADMFAVGKEAAMGPTREATKLPVGTPLRPISKHDFERALGRVSPSVTPNTVSLHKAFQDRFK